MVPSADWTLGGMVPLAKLGNPEMFDRILPTLNLTINQAETTPNTNQQQYVTERSTLQKTMYQLLPLLPGARLEPQATNLLIFSFAVFIRTHAQFSGFVGLRLTCSNCAVVRSPAFLNLAFQSEPDMLSALCHPTTRLLSRAPALTWAETLFLGTEAAGACARYGVACR
jgi:hypothetical protein